MRRTYRYRLYPSAAQEREMEGWLEKLRWLYNRALAERRNAWRYRGENLSAYKQKANLPALKARRPEFAQVHSQVLQDAVLRLDEAFENFFRRVKNGAGKPGYPRFKGEGRYRSFRYPQASAFKVLDGGKKMRLGGIGNVQLKYHRPMEGTPKTATVVRYPSGKWYVCVCCELPEAPPAKPADAEKMTGYDLGLTSYAVSSDGAVVEPLRSLRRSEKKLRREQRRLSRTKKDSKRRGKQRLRVARVHEKVKERRRDFLHKTSRKLVEENEGLAFERLQVANMMGNRRLAKAIADAGWHTFTTMAAYKALRAGKPFVLVEPGGTTQECSRCGTRVAKSLADRVHECPVCSLVLDRDHNAALNVRSRAGTALTNARGEITSADELPHPQVASSKREAPSFRAG